ncbi:Phosphotransferase enzyme family protein [Maioricimonas rarisocia]|uniref:Phosphotransferase enzyme family protein n=1 Tax=Maioricimonas rarisocia TaxID=2528026 RepID=A0A517ZC06_9PLAN|nr:bifunctional aminoglycoside phosphotransferase/ATP-binding protein [Maioricimonas rarisocia]QDU39992.1 Phosphotransferase enzyme family protein [Maioricimonas rarisocia]
MSGLPHGTTLIDSLQRAEAFPHPVDEIRLLETHISWVLLAGEWAYKIKKPVDLGFLNFSTLEKRRHFCEEELRLNGRLAPDLYLCVEPITGSEESPRIGGDGDPIEYAVKMRLFPQEMLLSRLIGQGELRADEIDSLADEVVEFHGRIAVATAEGRAGRPDQVRGPAQANLDVLRNCPAIFERCGEDLGRLERWEQEEAERCRSRFAERLRDGFVRECHGDMHLGNMVRGEDGVLIFDGIEFSEELRWTDVMSEVAFAVMDLEDRGRADFAHRFLDRYLAGTGDYAGLDVLRYYLVYRALVRAKVAAIRLGQSDVEEADRRKLIEQCTEYIELASRYSERLRPFLAITHGVSGSGKTTGTQPLVEQVGAIRVRSDIERKRLFGLPPEASTEGKLEQQVYSQESTRRTYDRLAELAEGIVSAGFPVVVDATFLSRSVRQRFAALADRMRVPFRILCFDAKPQVLERRLAQRGADGRDASEADVSVMRGQLDRQEPLTDVERCVAVTISPEVPLDVPEFCSELGLVRAAESGTGGVAESRR